MSLEHQFLPAIVPYVQWRDPAHGRSVHWLDPAEPEFYHPAVLLSYEYWRKDRFTEGGDDMTIFGDSGGYSVVTQGASIDPTTALQWQQRVCTRGVMLDIPPYSRGSVIQFTGKANQHWQDSMARAEQNVRRALPIYQAGREEGRSFDWWGVVQGETWEQLEEWHGRIASIYSFDEAGEGWALAPKPSTDFEVCARHLRFAHEKGLRRVHFLQVTSARLVGMLFALAQQAGNIDLITYDSATAARCAINRNAVIEAGDGLGLDYLKQPGMEGIVTDHLMECSCAACEWIRELWPLTNTQFPHYLLLHNHLTMVRVFDRLYREALQHPDELLTWAIQGKSKETFDGWHRRVSPNRSKHRKRGMMHLIQ